VKNRERLPINMKGNKRKRAKSIKTKKKKRGEVKISSNQTWIERVASDVLNGGAQKAFRNSQYPGNRRDEKKR